MRTALRAALAGAGFGLAAASVDTWQGLLPVLFVRIPPSWSLAIAGALLEIGLLALIGLLLAPLLWLRGGSFWHLVGLGGVWAGMQRALAFDAAFFSMFAQFGPALAFGLAVAGLGLARWRRWVPVAAGGLLLAAAVVTPHVYLALSTPPKAVHTEVVPPPALGAPDVLVVVLDTVRAANVSAYGYERPTTPVFDALALEGALFLDATSPSTWSLPSHASLFTGLFPSSHGAHQEYRFLDAGPPTLAEVLAAAGWETRCFTANAFIGDSLGLTRGFQWSDEAWRSGGAGRAQQFAFRLLDWLGFGAEDKGGSVVAANFERWVEERPTDARPAFTFVNFVEAHFPYHQLPDAYVERFTQRSRRELRALSMELMAAQFGGDAPDPNDATGPATDMYAGGIVYTDDLLGRLVEALRRRGTLDRTILVVLSDHGEMLGEHREFGHGAAMYEPGIRVPFLVRYPPAVPAGARVATPVSTVGVFATVLDLAGIESTGALHVGSLVPAISGGPPAGPVLSERHMAPAFAASEGPNPLSDRSVRVRTYRAGSWKLAETSAGGLFLFDLASDPDETTNLATARPDQLARLRQELDTWRRALALPAVDASVERGEPPELDPEARERLRALGYVE